MNIWTVAIGRKKLLIFTFKTKSSAVSFVKHQLKNQISNLERLNNMKNITSIVIGDEFRIQKENIKEAKP